MTGLATLGDVMTDDWRALARANDIPRRAAPKNLGPGRDLSRPDRGYIDQSPAPATPRPPTVIPLERLEEAQAISEQELGPPPELPSALHEKVVAAGERILERQESSPEELAALSMEGMEEIFEDFHEKGEPEPEKATEPDAPPAERRRYHHDERRAWREALALEYLALREKGENITQLEFAQRKGTTQSMVSTAVRESGLELPGVRLGGSRQRFDPAELDRIASEGIAILDGEDPPFMYDLAARWGISVSHLSKRIAQERQRRAAQHQETSMSTAESTLMSRPQPESTPASARARQDRGGGRTYRSEEERRAIIAGSAGLTDREAAAKYQLSSPTLIGRWRETFGNDGQKGLPRSKRVAPAPVPPGTPGIVPTSIAPKSAASPVGEKSERTFEVVAAELAACKLEAAELAQRMGRLKKELSVLLLED